MLDTTGEGLHKRGYRRNAMEAPLRETLAATIADLGRVRRDSLVEDPFCGSGTLLIEAAQKAMNIAPGLKRRFAAERYSFVPSACGQSSARRHWQSPSWMWALSLRLRYRPRRRGTGQRQRQAGRCGKPLPL